MIQEMRKKRKHEAVAVVLMTEDVGTQWRVAVAVRPVQPSLQEGKWVGLVRHSEVILLL